MDNIENSKMDVYERVHLCQVDIDSLTTTIPDYDAEVVVTDNAYAELKNLKEKQKADSGNLRDEVAIAKHFMGKMTRRYILRGAFKARKLGNTVLADQLSHPISYFTKASKSDAIQRVTDMRDLLNNNLGTLTNILPADITIIDNAKTAYETIQQAPRHDVETKKAEGTDLMAEQFHIADKAIQNRYDLIVSYFEDSHPEVVNKFAEAMHVINTAQRHTVATVICVDADSTLHAPDNFIKGATFKIVELDLIATSNEWGLAGIGSFKHGLYHIEVTMPGFVPFKQMVNFLRGKTTYLEIDMHRVAP